MRFCVLLGDAMAWQSPWLQAPHTVVPFFVALGPHHGSGVLRLVVESEFSGGARCVWVEPMLLLHPLPTTALTELMGAGAATPAALPHAAGAPAGPAGPQQQPLQLQQQGALGAGGVVVVGGGAGAAAPAALQRVRFLRHARGDVVTMAPATFGGVQVRGARGCRAPPRAGKGVRALFG